MSSAARYVRVAMCLVLAIGAVVLSPAAAQATPSLKTTLWLNKTAVDAASGAEISAPISPGTSFDYRLTVYCSRLGPGCINARTVDVIPSGITITPPKSTASTRVQYDAATRVLTVTYRDRLRDPGSNHRARGIRAGATRTVVIGARVDAQAPEGLIVNTGRTSARNTAPVSESAAVTVGTSTNGTVTVAGSNALSDTTLITLTQPLTTSTIGIRNSSPGGAPVSSLTAAVSSPTWNLFSLNAIGPVSVMPGGADQVSLQYCTVAGCTADQYTALPPVLGSELALPAGIDPRSVVGLKFVFSNSTGAPLPASTAFSVQPVVFELRDDDRDSGTVLDPAQPTTANICTVPIAESPTAGTVRGDDACSTVSYEHGPTDVATSVQIFPDVSGSYAANGVAVEGESSPVSLWATAQNTSSVPVNTLALFKRSNEGDTVDISSVRLTFPEGADTAEVTLQCSTGSSTSTIPAPSGGVVDLAVTDSCSADDPLTQASVSYAGVIPSGAVGGLGYHGTLTAAVVAPQYSECIDGAVLAGALGQTSQTACGQLSVQSPSNPTGSVAAAISYTGGVDAGLRIYHGQPITYRMTTTNTGSSPATDFVVDNPAAGATGNRNVFNALALTGLSLAAPAGVAELLVLEIYDPQSQTWLAYDGATSDQLAASQGIRARQTGGEVPAGTTVTVSVTAQLRDAIGVDGVVQNCQSSALTTALGPFETGAVCAPQVTAGD